MNVNIKKLGKSEVELKVSIPWSEWKSFTDKAAEEISQDVKIKGFRPGKAPKSMVEQKVGKGSVLETAARKVIQKTYPEVIQKEKVDAIGSPQIEITKLAEGNDLEYAAKTAIMPEIIIKSWQKDIQKINKQFKDQKNEVTEEEVVKELNGLAKSRVKLVTVNREAKKGDSVEISFQVKRGGVPIENGTSRNHPMVLGTGAFIPGFEDQIIGMKEQEEKEFDLKFPDKYHDKNLEGKPATFKVKVNLVQERQTPEVNDDFAKSLGKFEHLDALKKNLKEGISEEKNEKAKEQRRADFLDKLVDLMEVDLPEVLVRAETHKMIAEFKAQIEGMGMQMAAYLEKMKKTEEDLEKDWLSQAEKRVKASLVLEQIAKNMDMKISSKDIEDEMNKILQDYKNIKDAEKNIDMERLYNYVKGNMTNERVFEFLERL